MYATYTCLIVCPCLLIQLYYIIKRKEKEKENKYWLRDGRQFMTTTSLFSSQVPENSKNPCKTGTMRTDYSCTEGKFISLKARMTLCDNRSFRYTTICHLPDTQVGGRPMSWSSEITSGLGWLHLSRNTLQVVICVSGWKIAHSNLLDHSCLTRCLTDLGK